MRPAVSARTTADKTPRSPVRSQPQAKPVEGEEHEVFEGRPRPARRGRRRLREHGRDEYRGRGEQGVRRARGPGQQDLRPALDVRRLHQLRQRHPAHGGGPPPLERDGLSQRRAVLARRADRRAISRVARQVRAEGLGAARRRRHAGKAGEHRTDPGRQQSARDQVLRLRLHPDLPADLHHRGAVGRVRAVPGPDRRAGTEVRPDADRPQPRHRVRDASSAAGRCSTS